LREVFTVGLDLAAAILRRYSIIYLLCGVIPVKDRQPGNNGCRILGGIPVSGQKLSRLAARFVNEKWVPAGFIAVTTAFYLISNYVPAVRILFYGNPEGMQASRASILPMAVSLSIMLVYCCHFYSGKKSRICYLVFTAYTINELVMFTLHPLFSLLLNGISMVIEHLVIEGNAFVIRNFYLIYDSYQIIWQSAFYIVVLVTLYYAIGVIKRNLSCAGRELTRIQELFLAVPGGIGLCFCVMLRSIMYAYNGSEIRFLMDEYPETRLLVPVVSGLCLLSIILSVLILKKLVESSEKETLLEVYRNRISDMEEHMKDVERLYDGIRGMRHDMKNCVADLEILLQKRERDSGEYEAEVRRYLDGLCLAIEELDMRCSTGNPVTDVVLSRKIRRAEQEQIPFECNFIFPEGLGISAFDLSILLNNGLDNAIEASQKEKNPYIRLDSYRKGSMFFIEMRNAFSGSLTETGTENVLRTTKPDSAIHGLGIKNMRNCAEKYYGTLRYSSGKGVFLLAVMLQGKENQNEYKN